MNITALLADMTQIVAGTLRADLAGLVEVSENGQSLRQTVWSLSDEGSSDPQVDSLSPLAECSLAAYCLQAGHMVTVSDLTSDRRFGDRKLQDLGAKSGLCVPVLFHDETVCLLGAFRRTQSPFTPAETATAERLAGQLAAMVGAIRGEGGNSAVQQSAGSESAARRPADHRVSPRRDFRYEQLIAPYRGSRRPTRGEFYFVECRDLSGGGIAIYLPEPPDFENLVVALGPPRRANYFTAKVVRVQSVTDHGRQVFVVGCRFTGRASM